MLIYTTNRKINFKSFLLFLFAHNPIKTLYTTLNKNNPNPNTITFHVFIHIPQIQICKYVKRNKC